MLYKNENLGQVENKQELAQYVENNIDKDSGTRCLCIDTVVNW